jgi:creatinine amidohydrolase
MRRCYQFGEGAILLFAAHATTTSFNYASARMAVHDLRSMTWPAFKALDRSTLVAVLPLGAIEAHGPHLPLGTDIVIAEAMARAGAESLSRRGLDVVILPALPVAPAPFAAAFEGTLDTPPAATTAVIAGIARSLARSGVTVVAVANAHHDPAHVSAIRAAVEACDAEGGATLVFPDLTRRRWAERLTDEFRSGACHAGRYEGSIVLAEAADLVDTAALAALPANPRSLVDAIRSGGATFLDAGGPDAYFGWPAEATAAEGREIIERLGELLADAVTEGLSDEERVTKSRARRAKDPASEQLRPVNPPALGRPVGFSHGLLAPASARLLSVAGQIATDASGEVTEQGFAAQFRVALERVLAIVRAAGGHADNIARLTIYVTDVEAYRASRPQLADAWPALMGRHYPAMALVEVQGLVDQAALVEIAADAMLPAAPAGSGQVDMR